MSAQAVIDLVNSLDVEDGVDGLEAWLVARGVRPTRAALVRARAVREALRDLLLAHNGVPVDVAAASAVLDRAARRVRLRFRDGRPALEAGSGGLDAALGAVLAAVAAARADGTWERLKACRAETCRWAFYDRARNRSRTWCSMAVCGNRTKARRYRARRSPG